MCRTVLSGFGAMCVCCVWDSLVRVMGERMCAVFGTVWFG